MKKRKTLLIALLSLSLFSCGNTESFITSPSDTSKEETTLTTSEETTSEESTPLTSDSETTPTSIEEEKVLASASIEVVDATINGAVKGLKAEKVEDLALSFSLDSTISLSYDDDIKNENDDAISIPNKDLDLKAYIKERDVYLDLLTKDAQEEQHTSLITSLQEGNEEKSSVKAFEAMLEKALNATSSYSAYQFSSADSQFHFDYVGSSAGISSLEAIVDGAKEDIQQKVMIEKVLSDDFIQMPLIKEGEEGKVDTSKINEYLDSIDSNPLIKRCISYTKMEGHEILKASFNKNQLLTLASIYSLVELASLNKESETYQEDYDKVMENYRKMVDLINAMEIHALSLSLSCSETGLDYLGIDMNITLEDYTMKGGEIALPDLGNTAVSAPEDVSVEDVYIQDMNLLLKGKIEFAFGEDVTIADPGDKSGYNKIPIMG